MLNRPLLARGSNIKKEKQENIPENDETSSNKQQTSSKTRFGWNDLYLTPTDLYRYMKSHYDSDTKNRGEETKLGL